MGLKSGVCDACGASDIYSNVGSNRRSERAKIVLSGFKWFYIDTYLCGTCGKFEEFMDEETFRDEVAQKKLRENWKKVYPKLAETSK